MPKYKGWLLDQVVQAKKDLLDLPTWMLEANGISREEVAESIRSLESP